MKKAYNPKEDFSGKYEPENFKSSFEKLRNVKKTLESLVRDPMNDGLILNTGEMLLGDKEILLKSPNPPYFARKIAEQAYSEGEKELLNYTERNMDKLIELLDKNKLTALLYAAPPKTKDKKVNKIVRLIEKQNQAIEAVKTTKSAKEYVLKRIEPEPEWYQTLIKSYIENPGYAEAFLQHHLQNDLEDYNKELKNYLKEINENELKKILKKSLKECRDKQKAFGVLSEIAYLSLNKESHEDFWKGYLKEKLKETKGMDLLSNSYADDYSLEESA